MKKCYPFLLKNWLRLGFLAAFVAFISINAFAQNGPAKQWDKTFGGNKNETITIVRPTIDGGYILGGYSDSDSSNSKSQNSKGLDDYWIVKIDANGNKVWDKTYGGNKSDRLFTLQQTTNGGYILGGVSESDISGDKTQACKGLEDYWIVKIDANGNKVWDKTIGGQYIDYFASLYQTTDGGYILGGYSISDISGDKTELSRGQADFWIVKVDSLGNKLWDKTIGGSERDELISLQQTSDGGIL